MCGSLLLIAMMATGNEYGYRPLPQGGMEYLVQIEPSILNSQSEGVLFKSDVPPKVQDIRLITVMLGRNELPKIDPTGQRELTSIQANFRNVKYPDEDPNSNPIVPPSVGPTNTYQPSTYGANREHEANGLNGQNGAFEQNGVYGNNDPISQAPESHQPWMESTDPSNSLPQNVNLFPPTSSSLKKTTFQTDPIPPKKSVNSSNQILPKEVAESMPLTLTIAALVAALGGMLYLGIIAWDYRRRYRDLLRQLIERAGDGRLVDLEAQI